jgi:phenylpropionate dioxygenase-like ring-hydroxylating dioxygenase large terminal subunit
MIPNQWYAVLESHEVKRGKPVGLTRMGEKMVFWRDEGGKVVAQSDLCPHRGVALSAGELKGECIMCPFHGFLFDRSGRCTLIPANGKNAPVPKAFHVKTYPTCEANDFIFIYWGELKGDIGGPPWFTDLDGGFTYASDVDRWTTHYSRAIENQLDIPHVPFVHDNTIGRRSGTVNDGPCVEWRNNDRFWFYPVYRQDDGVPVLRPDEMPAPTQEFHIEFIFPNLWQNYLSEKLREILAFVPVDEENTVIYLRQYQKFVRIPGVRTVFNKLSMPVNKFVLHQDRRVVLTQRPKVTSLRMGEKLIPADAPIIEYRRHRQKLIDATTSHL